MGLTSLQVQMDPSDWLQDDGALDSSSPSSADMLACSRAPLMERRLRPPHDLALKCPRCESTNTKFCYYNNYSLTQPRYFCKTCRRYWTKGGTLRNIPVGGGCRKNKRQSSTSSKKPEPNTAISATQSHITLTNPTELQLSFPEVQLSHHHLASLMSGGGIGTSFLDNKYHALLDRSNGYDGYLGSKFDALMDHSTNTNTRAHDLLGSPSIGVDFGVGGIGDHHHNVHSGLVSAPNYNFMTHLSSSSPFGVSGEGNSSGVLESSNQRLMLPYDYHNANSNAQDDVKPNPKLLSLQWQDNNGGANANRESFGYNINGGFGGLSSWGGSMFNGYTPSSTTNTLI